MSEGPVISVYARVKKRATPVVVWWVLGSLLILFAVGIAVRMLQGSSKAPSYNASSAAQMSTPQEVHDHITPQLESAMQELQSTEKSLQQDLDIADLDREINNIVVE